MILRVLEMTKGIKSEKGKRGEEVELLKVNRIKK